MKQVYSQNAILGSKQWRGNVIARWIYVQVPMVGTNGVGHTRFHLQNMTSLEICPESSLLEFHWDSARLRCALVITN